MSVENTMKILVLYGTTEGQTGKIAEFCAGHLGASGHDFVVKDCSKRLSDLEISDFDRVILAGSVHQGRHQETLESFVFARRQELESVPTLLISVSLSIAFENGEEEAVGYVQTFAEMSEFQPRDVVLIGGALKFEKYGYYMSNIVEHVVLKDREQITEDREFTDWDKLKSSLDAFVAS